MSGLARHEIEDVIRNTLSKAGVSASTWSVKDGVLSVLLGSSVLKIGFARGIGAYATKALEEKLERLIAERERFISDRDGKRQLDIEDAIRRSGLDDGKQSAANGAHQGRQARARVARKRFEENRCEQEGRSGDESMDSEKQTARLEQFWDLLMAAVERDGGVLHKSSFMAVAEVFACAPAVSDDAGLSAAGQLANAEERAEIDRQACAGVIEARQRRHVD